MGQYRKLAAWFGAYDEFIYVDCDVIVLSEFSLIYDFLREFDVIVSHSNIPSIRKWVWKDVNTFLITHKIKIHCIGIQSCVKLARVT